MHSDEYFMNKALDEAKKALLVDEVPIGAVVVLNGKIIARAHNLRESSQDPTSHAEILAIRKAAKKLKSWRMPEIKIYVTIEPCSMCAGAILWSRAKEVIYGAKDIKGGALGSSYDLFSVPNINHHPLVKGGVLEKECSDLIINYFKSKRLNNGNI